MSFPAYTTTSCAEMADKIFGNSSSDLQEKCPLYTSNFVTTTQTRIEYTGTNLSKLIE